MQHIHKLIFLFLLLFAVTACNAENIAAETESETTNSGDLIIYSGRSESLVQPLIDQFAEAAGINVEVRYGSTSEMAGLLLEEGEKSTADIFYAQDPGGIGAVSEAGLFSTLSPETLAKVPSRFAAEDGAWVGISGRARTVVYNTDEISDPETQLPADLMGFVDPAWNGRLGWAPANGSFQAMVTAMRSVWGEEKTREWLLGIQANNPLVYDNNTPIVEAVSKGEIAVGLVNHYYLYRFLTAEGDTFAARNYFLPGGGPGSLIMVSGAGILESAKNKDNAQRFIDFLLSLPAQQYFASQTFEYPLIEGVTTASNLPPLAELDAVAIDIPLGDLADLQGTQDMLVDLGIIE